MSTPIMTHSELSPPSPQSPSQAKEFPLGEAMSAEERVKLEREVGELERSLGISTKSEAQGASSENIAKQQLSSTGDLRKTDGERISGCDESGEDLDVRARKLKMLALMHTRLGRSERAVLLLTEFVDAEESNGLSAMIRSDLHVTMGALLFHLDRMEDSSRSFKKATECAPTNEKAWESAATMLRQAGRHEEATAAYAECVSLQPRNPRFLTSYAMAMLDKFSANVTVASIAEAHAASGVATATGAADSSPAAAGENESQTRRRNLYLELLSTEAVELPEADAKILEEYRQKRDEAIKKPMELLELAREIEPQNVDTQVAYAQALHFLERIEEAGAEMEKALSGCPDDVDIIINLATIWTQLKKFEEAQSFLEKAKLMQPSNPDVYIMTCKLHSDWEKFGEAFRIFNELLEALPDDVESHSAAGIAMADAGKEEELMIVYRQWLDKHPNSQAAKFFDYAFGPSTQRVSASSVAWRWGIHSAFVIALILTIAYVASGVSDQTWKESLIFLQKIQSQIAEPFTSFWALIIGSDSGGEL